jgi:PP-loop superfamily ATP-utilizing enzyme
VITVDGKLTPNFEYIAKLRPENDLQMNTMMKKVQVNKTEVGETASVLNTNVTIIPSDKIEPEQLDFSDDS